jgi:predicted AlkP superfamily pyrophosphatase or phosphodiesterase
VLLVIDGLGWNQLQTRTHRAPTISGMEGGPITTVAPSTTATALTSITTGLTPGQHGVVGYRMAVGGEILNVLRWNTKAGDARESIPPEKVQSQPCFGGQRPPAITRAEFATSGFTGAHLDGVRFTGYRTLGTLAAEIIRVARSGEPFVYAYYEALDKVSHEYGLGAAYDEELHWIDELVARLLDQLPPGTVLVVTADHGQVEVGDRILELPRAVLSHVAFQSGEGRFRWLHARSGRTADLADAARDLLGDHAWVRTRAEAIQEGWYGPTVSDTAAGRLGDVLLAAKGDVAFNDPDDTGPYVLVGRHGSLTADEMLVPLLAGVAH